MKIENARYIKIQQMGADGKSEKVVSSIACTLNGSKVSVPLDSDNSDYAEILRQVANGSLTIKDAG